MTEDYAIEIRIGRAEGTGRYVITNRGNRREITKFKERYKTKAGEFLPEEWKKLTLQEIEKAGKMELLERIKQHCREHCAWLRREPEIEEYAMGCLCSRAYEYWPDFQEEIIWM